MRILRTPVGAKDFEQRFIYYEDGNLTEQFVAGDTDCDGDVDFDDINAFTVALSGPRADLRASPPAEGDSLMFKPLRRIQVRSAWSPRRVRLTVTVIFLATAACTLQTACQRGATTKSGGSAVTHSLPRVTSASQLKAHVGQRVEAIGIARHEKDDCLTFQDGSFCPILGAAFPGIWPEALIGKHVVLQGNVEEWVGPMDRTLQARGSGGRTFLVLNDCVWRLRGSQ